VSSTQTLRSAAGGCALPSPPNATAVTPTQRGYSSNRIKMSHNSKNLYSAQILITDYENIVLTTPTILELWASGWQSFDAKLFFFLVNYASKCAFEDGETLGMV
jgi:hypothetical protein